MNHYIERVVDLIPEETNRIYNMTVDEARRCILSGDTEEVRQIDGSFALTTRAGKTVRMARSLDRPMRYFLAKRQEGPALVVADRIDLLYAWLKSEGLHDQFHPTYSRMVPAHYVVELQLIGCPDPDPVYTRFLNPRRNALPTDTRQIGAAYISALADEIAKWLKTVPGSAPVGVCFSGGIDSGAAFLVTYHTMKRLGMNLGRLKAFTLSLGNGPDLDQARQFLRELDLELFLEPIELDRAQMDYRQTIEIVEDYKPLDIQAATMLAGLCQGIRQRYPDWRFLIDGDGGDENLKSYPIEENPELTIRSVVNNPLLYHEGWGVGKIKHSLTYSGGLSRSYTRTYATMKHFQFDGFSPFTRPAVVEAAEGIPFVDLTQYEVDRLYRLKGEIVGSGVQAVTGLRMPVFPKRRFQHGALPAEQLHQIVPGREADLRRHFHALYEK